MVCRESPASNSLQLQRELPLQEKNRTGIKSVVGGGGGGVGGGGVGGVGGGGGRTSVAIWAQVRMCNVCSA